MVNIRKMWVFVCHFEMHMLVFMRLLPIPNKVVNVLVVNIVGMNVLMI